MIPTRYLENGCFTKHPLKDSCLGYQVYNITLMTIHHIALYYLEMLCCFALRLVLLYFCQYIIYSYHRYDAHGDSPGDLLGDHQRFIEFVQDFLEYAVSQRRSKCLGGSNGRHTKINSIELNHATMPQGLVLPLQAADIPLVVH